MLIRNAILAALIGMVLGTAALAQLQMEPPAELPHDFFLLAQQTQSPNQLPQANTPIEMQQMQSSPDASQRSGVRSTVIAELPRPAQVQSTESRLGLEELEQLALDNNPTLRQAAAEVRAAAGRRLQAGLFPNPRVGYTGEEIRGGSARGGQQGFFVEQDIVLGGKLGLGRKVFDQEIRMAELELDEQRQRVLNAVRLSYYQVLSSQQMGATLRDLARTADESVNTVRRLRNIGQMDETELLQAEVEAQQAGLAVLQEQTRLQHLWTALTAVMGIHSLPLTTLSGNLEENLPVLDEQILLASILNESPAMKIAGANIERSEAQLSREHRQSVPDLQLRGGLLQNRGRAEPLQRSVGLQGFAEIGLQIPIFNRNQGAVEAAKAAQERAVQEQTRLQLVLRERTSASMQQYTYARVKVERYRTDILPRAQRAYELMLKRWGQMAASYPQPLTAQRTLFQAQTEYVAALGRLWESAITLQGFLLTDGLEAPSRPGEVDLPVREGNIPTPRGIAAGRE